MSEFVIKMGEKEIARLSGEGIVFGRRVNTNGPKGLMETQLVDDPGLLKKLNEHGDALFIVALSRSVHAERID